MQLIIIIVYIKKKKCINTFCISNAINCVLIKGELVINAPQTSQPLE